MTQAEQRNMCLLPDYLRNGAEADQLQASLGLEPGTYCASGAAEAVLPVRRASYLQVSDDMPLNLVNAVIHAGSEAALAAQEGLALKRGQHSGEHRRQDEIDCTAKRRSF